MDEQACEGCPDSSIVVARYITIHMTEPATENGYKINEIKLSGPTGESYLPKCDCRPSNDCEMPGQCQKDGTCLASTSFLEDGTFCNSVPNGVCHSGICTAQTAQPPTDYPTRAPITHTPTTLAPTNSPTEKCVTLKDPSGATCNSDFGGSGNVPCGSSYPVCLSHISGVQWGR